MAKQVDPEWTRQRIDELVTALANAGLVRRFRAGIYEIHPLLTSYLRSHSAAPEPCQRAFVNVIGTLADGLAQRPHNEQRGVLLLHGANFHFALHLSQRLPMDLHFGALTQSLAGHALNSRNFLEASRLYEGSAQHAAALANWEWEATAYHQLGVTAEEQRDFATARQWYLKSLAISEKQGYLDRVASTYHQLGNLAREQRDFATAREWNLKSLTISEKQDNQRGRCPKLSPTGHGRSRAA